MIFYPFLKYSPKCPYISESGIFILIAGCDQTPSEELLEEWDFRRSLQKSVTSEEVLEEWDFRRSL